MTTPRTRLAFFEAVERIMYRLPPLQGLRFYVAAVAFCAVFFIPILVLTCWVCWSEVSLSLRKPEGV